MPPKPENKIPTGFTLAEFSQTVQSDVSSFLNQVPCWGLVLSHSTIKIVLYRMWMEIHDKLIQFPNLTLATISVWSLFYSLQELRK